MLVGVSLYPDLMSRKEIKQKLQEAKANKIDIIFTSAQLDNLDFSGLNSDWNNFLEFFKEAKRLNLKTSVDVSKDSLPKFKIKSNNNLKPLKDLGIYSIRIDGGYSAKEIAKFTSNKQNIKVEINASMIDDLDGWIKIIKKEGNIKNLLSCHNFFPRKYTGLGWDRFDKYNELIRKHGVKIGAFVSTQNSKSKLCKTSFAVPTIESHRYTDIKYQIEDFKVRNLDYVIISEDSYTAEEIKVLSKASKEKHINIYVDKMKMDISKELLWFRADQPEFIRRTLERLGKVKPVKSTAKKFPKFAVTIDNTINERYSGEVQFMLQDMKYEKYMNQIGMIAKEQWDLASSEHLLFHKVKFIKNKR